MSYGRIDVLFASLVAYFRESELVVSSRSCDVINVPPFPLHFQVYTPMSYIAAPARYTSMKRAYFTEWKELKRNTNHRDHEYRKHQDHVLWQHYGGIACSIRKSTHRDAVDEGSNRRLRDLQYRSMACVFDWTVRLYL